MQKLLLSQPDNNQLLYKFIKWQNFYSSVVGGYLYFNRVDLYDDFTNSDQSDGEQLPLDRINNEKITFIKDPSYSLSKLNDDSRSKTYACCFSLECTDYMWEKYGNNGQDSLCLVFNFGKLRQILNETFNSSAVIDSNSICSQIFSITYGNIEYVDRERHKSKHPNNIYNTYYKSDLFKEEREFRIALSTPIGKYMIGERELIFPKSTHFLFNFQKAFEDETIESIITYNNDHDIKNKLKQLGIQQK